jgi:hypothetical protein
MHASQIRVAFAARGVQSGMTGSSINETCMFPLLFPILDLIRHDISIPTRPVSILPYKTMTALRYFDNVPHIVRYGMHSENDERSYIWLWRCGLQFTIHADGKDFRGTDFYSQWKPLVHEYPSAEQSMTEFAENQWYPLCDLILSTSMPTLKRLAPDREYWTTLRNYIHTPRYTLRLVALEDRASIETRVEDGPVDCGTGAYGLTTVSRDTFSLPEDLQTFQSGELRVLDMETGDWRRRPAKVELEDGSMFEFLACERDFDNGMRDASAVDASVGHIRTRLEKMQDQHRDPEEMQEVCGVVLDCSPFTSNAALNGKDRAEGAKGQEERIVGLLLPWAS